MGTDITNVAAGDTRVPLKPGARLNVFNSQKGQITYTVEGEAGRGGSSLVYSGYYVDNSGVRKPVRIKECYPFRLRIAREESGKLTADGRDGAAYEKAAARMKESFRLGNELFVTGGLTNSISNALDLYEANNTVYIVTAYLEGAVLTPELFDSLKDAAAVVKSVAETIGKIHDRGYLYLDLKPENVFVLKNVTQMSVLFDFDSLVSSDETEEGETGVFRCTRGFAALEQRTGNGKQIGRHTDVYGVGALLYYLLFGRTPDAFACDSSAGYDYSQSRYGSDCYRDKLYDALTDFFHHTLPGAWQDRYPDLTETAAKLAEIEGLADLTKPFLCGSYLPDRIYMTGREQEERLLEQWLFDKEKKCLFVTGMGGIGKSTLVRSCISKNRGAFDTVLYLYYSGSVPAVIGDDSRLCVNTVERLEKESDQDYFKRKLHVVRQIVSGTYTLLVMDDFDGRIDEDFCDVLQAGWKVIVITRSENRAAKDYDTIKVGRIQRREALYQLFAVNLGREIREEETVWLNRMIEKLQSHTLVLELLAKQTARSCLTLREAAELLEKHGFADLAPEKVDYVKDGKLYYNKIAEIITVLFSGERMSRQKKVLLRMLALFDIPGVGMEDFRRMLGEPPLDLFHELQGEGWIQAEHSRTYDRVGSVQADLACPEGDPAVNVYLSLHSVIRETVRQWTWTEEYREPGLAIMGWLFQRLRPEGEGDKKRRKRALDYYLRLSVHVLDSLGREGVLTDTAEYLDLLSNAILNTPRERESYIMSRSEEFFRRLGLWDPADESGQGRINGGGSGGRNGRKGLYNPRAVLNVCDILVFIHCGKGEYEQAYKRITSMEKMVKRQRNPHFSGMYYSILSQYYDALLGGAYDAWSKEEKRILHRMMAAENRAVRCMSKAKEEDSGQCLTRYLLGRAALLIRSRGKAGKIKKLIHRGELLMEEHVPACSEIRQAYYLTCAWYYTMSKPDFELTEVSLGKACEIADMREVSELDRIDFIVVPCADMLLMWERGDQAAEWLLEGIACCDRYPDSLPYIRKKMELYSHLLDVYCQEMDFDRCRSVIEAIDRENMDNRWAGINREVPEEIRKIVWKEKE